MTYSKNSPVAHSSEGGFTLVELSIVLVIIGLIVGGVLMGQDLIRAAETRATIAQLEKYNTAINTFKLKYGILAGDAKYPGDSSTLITNADNNGILSTAPGVPTAAPTTIAGELLWFWEELSKAGFIDGKYSGVATGGTVLSAAASGTTLANFPSTKSNRGGIIAYGMPDGINYYHIGLAGSTTATITTADNLRPEEAFNIDKKVDDANPFAGAVLAKGGTVLEKDPSVKTGTTPSGCVTALSTGTYNLENAGAACQLRVKFN